MFVLSLKLHKEMKKSIAKNLSVITIETCDTDRQLRVRPSKLKKNAGILQLRACAALPESPWFTVPAITWQLKPSVNPRTKVPDVLFWPCWISTQCLDTYTRKIPYI